MGQSYIIDSFMVVVFGGVGNLWGTLVAGVSLGIFNKVLEPWAGGRVGKNTGIGLHHFVYPETTTGLVSSAWTSSGGIIHA